MLARTIAVTGKVLDENNLPLPQALIYGSLSENGTYSDLDGNFSLEVLSNDTLVVSFIGYKESRIPVNGTSSFEIKLRTDAKVLDAAVVTALGIKREEKSLGYSVSKMDVQSATVNRDPNLVNSMQGKLAGVNISKTSGGPGASSRIVIRGVSSITGTNQPLVVVDGIPIDNGRESQTSQWGGLDYGSPISDINPDDIASLTVLKGPSAAALYGSRGLNGVIVITTKSGQGAGNKLQVSFNSNTTIDTPYIVKEFQNKYGAGSGGQFEFNEEGIPFFNTNRPNLPTYASSWGPEMLGQDYIDWNGERTTFSPQPDNYRKFFETGYTATNNLSFSKGGNFPFRISITDLHNQGINPTSKFQRQNLNFSHGKDINKKWRYSIKTTLSRQDAFNRVNHSNGDNAARNIIMMPRSVSAESMMNFEDSEFNENTWYGGSWVGNPFFTTARHLNYDERLRLLGNFSLSYSPFEWLSATGRIGNDGYVETRHNRLAARSVNAPGGQFVNQNIRFNERNMDMLVTATPKFKNEKLDLTINAGGNRMFQKTTSDNESGVNILEYGIYEVSNVEEGNSFSQEFLTQRAINSLYGSALLSYNREFFVELTGRNDWSSTLPAENNSYFYPSINASWVFSERLKERNDLLEYGKIRASVAAVGNDARPYLIALNYDSLAPLAGVQLQSQQSIFPNIGLRPERKRSFELGTDLYFLNSRLRVDFTYYYESTIDQILPSAPISATTGYRSAAINAGEIVNQGIELLLTGKIMKRENFSWTAIANYTRNRNEVVSLAEGVNLLQLGGQWRTLVAAVPGEPYGAIYGHGIQRNEHGTPLLAANGTYLRTEEQVLLGNATPDWQLGLTQAFSYKQFSLSFLVDVRKGGDLYSATNMYLHGYSGNALATLEGREEWYASEAEREAAGIAPEDWTPTGGYEVSGVYAEETIVNGEDVGGQEVTRFIDPQVYWSNFASWTNELHEPFVYDASFVKLRELSLNYRFKKGLFNEKVNGISLTLSGRNLWLIYSGVPNVDPEATYTNGNGQGVEYATYPMTRSIGINLKANF